MYLSYFLYFQWEKLPFSWLIQNSEHWRQWTDQEPWSTVCETWLDITCWTGAHWSWFGKIHHWSHSLSFPLQGTTDNFRCAHLLQLSLNAAMPWAPGETVWHTKQQLLWFWGSFSEGFIWSPSVAALQGNGDMWLSPLCPSHMMRHFTCHGTTPCGEQVLFYCLSSYTIYSSILLLCINFLSCPSCDICTVTSWFPLFNCPQKTSSRATPALVGALICHCPNWSSEHLKFSFYERVVFLQVRD